MQQAVALNEGLLGCSQLKHLQLTQALTLAEALGDVVTEASVASNGWDFVFEIGAGKEWRRAAKRCESRILRPVMLGPMLVPLRQMYSGRTSQSINRK